LNFDDYNTFCASLPATTHVVQWGGAHVWKVGGKVFAIAGWSDDEEPHIVFKTSDLAFDILREQKGLRPAPYLAPRGGKWIQMFETDALSDEDLFAYLKQSHMLISSKLTKKLRTELKLDSGPD
jgi:predicted DNA-binding protein (MmcQ/YjbR family)